ncbi:uncharacterized protein LOC129693342 isoform X2 [Leucoraja erinacea]|uniref:uncharacterized protein LOC129693342 isoform X2 n=1 Tax=Leucoraja erinaceus TaxID=7782 RepID=UPI002457B129|nr:uncharacterized protein LOC129693342 isoform X2 [Leucoraja erinacea]
MFPGVGADRRSGVAVFQWKKAGKGSAMKPVLQFHSGSREPAVIRSYMGRLTFFPHNGSMAFHNLTKQDAGLYQLYINLQKDAIQSVRLTVMDRLSEVSVWSNSSSLGSAVQLSCTVVGNPHVYQWRKDGGGISRHHQLMNGNTHLIIPGASSIDCGTYTCIASNPVSSAQENLTLTIYESRNILFHLLTWLSSWNTPSLVIIHIALISWIVIKGTFTVITGSLYIVSALFLTIMALMTIPKLQHPSVLNCVELTGFKILLEFSQTIVIPTSIIELKETFGQMSQGCHSRYLSWGTFLAVTTVGAMIFSIYIVARHRDDCRLQEGAAKTHTPQHQWHHSGESGEHKVPRSANYRQSHLVQEQHWDCQMVPSAIALPEETQTGLTSHQQPQDILQGQGGVCTRVLH